MNFADLKDFLDLVKNPAQYEDVINQFEAREKKWTELVEAHTEISKVGKYVADKEAQAREMMAEATTVLNDAVAAKAKQDVHLKEMTEMIEASKAEQVKAEAEAKQLVKEHKAFKAELQKQSEQLAADQSLVASRLVIIAEKEQELTAKLDAFKAIVA